MGLGFIFVPFGRLASPGCGGPLLSSFPCHLACSWQEGRRRARGSVRSARVCDASAGSQGTRGHRRGRRGRWVEQRAARRKVRGVPRQRRRPWPGTPRSCAAAPRAMPSCGSAESSPESQCHGRRQAGHNLDLVRSQVQPVQGYERRKQGGRARERERERERECVILCVLEVVAMPPPGGCARGGGQ